MMSNIRWICVCWVIVGFLSAGIAFADDPLAKPGDAIAREHLTRGNKLYRLREFEQAIEEYKSGALREDAHVFAYNLGQCYRQLGKYDNAIWHYERFLARAQPTGELKNAIDDFVKQMKAELEKKAMAQKPIEPAADSAKPSPTPAAPTVTEATEHVAPWYTDRVAWALAGAGALATGVGGYFLLDAADLSDRSNNEPRQELREKLRDQAGQRRLLGTIAGLGGLGLLASGIVKLTLHPTANEQRSTAWSIGLTRDGVQVSGDF